VEKEIFYSFRAILARRADRKNVNLNHIVSKGSLSDKEKKVPYIFVQGDG